MECYSDYSTLLLFLPYFLPCTLIPYPYDFLYILTLTFPQMARVRVTPIIRRRRGFAGLPGYITSTSSRRTRPRQSDEEWRAELAKKDEELRLQQVAIAEASAMNEEEGASYEIRHKRWLDMRVKAARKTRKDLKEEAIRFVPRRTYLGLRGEGKTLSGDCMRVWKRMDAITIPKRKEGYRGGYHFITDLERAFVKARVPADMQTQIGTDCANDGFATWFRRYRCTFHYHISWDEFIRALFTYIMAYAT